MAGLSTWESSSSIPASANILTAVASRSKLPLANPCMPSLWLVLNRALPAFEKLQALGSATMTEGEAWAVHEGVPVGVYIMLLSMIPDRDH